MLISRERGPGDGAQIQHQRSVFLVVGQLRYPPYRDRKGCDKRDADDETRQPPIRNQGGKRQDPDNVPNPQMCDDRECDCAHDGKASSDGIFATWLQPHPAALPGCYDGKDGRGDIGERPDKATNHVVNREHRIARLKEAPNIKEARSIEKID